MKRKLFGLVLALASPACTSSHSPQPASTPPLLVRKYQPNPAGVAEFIKDVTPGIEPAEATRLGKLIVKSCAKWRTDPLVLAAIIRHESGFRRELLANCESSSGCDYGLGQINQVHIDELHLDPEKLVFDDAYNLDVAARLLGRVSLFAAKEPNWYSRYHDSREGPRTRWEYKVFPFVEKARSELGG